MRSIFKAFWHATLNKRWPQLCWSTTCRQPMLLQRLLILMALGSLPMGTTHPSPELLGQLRLPSFLGDHMVLQRGGAVLWGWAAPGSSIQVTVKSAGQVLATVSTSAVAGDGEWQVPITVATPQLSTTVLVTAGSASVMLEDVAWGDVFLCSGQSNMEYPMADSFNGTEERLASNYANLRMLNLADRPWPVPTGFKNSSATDCPSKAPFTWAASKPETISVRNSSIEDADAHLGDGPTDFSDKYPSAICWFAAREIIHAQPSVPIGIISASKSGSGIECWMPEAALVDGVPHVFGGNGTCGGTVNPPTKPPGQQQHICPRNGLAKSGAYYRGMIAPLAKMRLTAVWWYQGEENDHPTDACPGPIWYRCLFPAMISYWRAQFASPLLPFYYVLLAAGHSAVLREAQVLGGGALPGTAFASALDLGAAAGEYLIPGHPPRKQEVGRRLGLVNRALVYNESGLDYAGPKVVSARVTVTEVAQGNTVHTTVVIPFTVGANGHLHLNGTAGCSICCSGSHGTVGVGYSNSSSPVALVDPDAVPAAGALPKVSKTETFVIDAAAGVLTATIPGWHASAGRAEVRFLFDNDPQCAVYNGALSGPDSVYAPVPHLGIVAQSWRGNVTVAIRNGSSLATLHTH